MPLESGAKLNGAIISSSSVRMTRTVTRLEFFEITAGSLRVARHIQFDAKKFQALADAGTDDGEFSPMPPAKTSVSNPPSAAA